MECTRCGREARYNRAIVSRREGTVVGGLCRTCEVAQYGDGLRCSNPVSGCLVCAADPAVVLPEHKLELVAVRGETRSEEHYGIDRTTPRLCATHAPTGPWAGRDREDPVGARERR